MATSTINNKTHVPELAIPIQSFSNKNFEQSPHPTPRTSNKPPKYPSPDSPLIHRRTSFKGKPKSRFGEPSLPLDSPTFENKVSRRYKSFEINDSQQTTPHSNRGVSFVDPLFANNVTKKKGKNAPDEKEIYRRVTTQLSARNSRRKTTKLLLQLVVFVVILGCLIASLTVENFKKTRFQKLEDWKWFVFLMVAFSGWLLTQLLVQLVVFLVEWKFMLRKNVVYFTHGLKNEFVVFIWTSIVLITWVVLVKSTTHVKISSTSRVDNFLDFVTWTLVSILIGAFMWLVKTGLIKVLAAAAHLNRFFERIQEAVFHHYVLQTLSGRPVVELATGINRQESVASQVSFTEHTESDHKEKKVVDWGKLYQMKQEKVPSWTMKLLVDVVSNSGLSTVSGMLEQNVVEGGVELDDNEITSEEEAIATAVRIFDNIVNDKDDQRYIDRFDLRRFLIREEVNLIYPLFMLDDQGHINLKAFSQWVVKIYKDRQALQHALNDNKTAVEELNKLLIGILIILVIILWLLLTEIATSKVVVFFSSQLIVAAFIFGNTCKTIFEAIIFVFIMHPFDVGDRCVIDGSVMVVEEMNILTTVFLKADKEKLYYPNAVLATKAIGNYYRSPDQGDSLEFSIDYMTPLSKIGELKDRIKEYLEKTPQLWYPDHSVVVREIENINKIKMTLIFNHTMNFQDILEKIRRKSELILEMKRIFDELQIRYNLLPQEIILKNTATSN